MTYLNPYLGLNGRCREAMTFYKECLGGDLFFMTVGESPMADQMPDQKQSILHASLTNGRVVLMATDCARESPVQGNTMALSLNCSSEEEIKTYFEKLSAGGIVTTPLGPQFWGGIFATLTDKFGMMWMLNYDKNTKEHSMEDIISQAKAELNRAKDRIAHLLAKTPDDKINWAPSPSARTPLQIVGHAAAANLYIRDLMVGKPFPFATLAEADAAGREAEKQFTTREQVLELLDYASADYCAWLDTLTPEQIGGMVTLPFTTLPMAVAITLPADHLRGHAAQLNYVQTIYGDHDWHIA